MTLERNFCCFLPPQGMARIKSLSAGHENDTFVHKEEALHKTFTVPFYSGSNIKMG